METVTMAALLFDILSSVGVLIDYIMTNYIFFWFPGLKVFINSVHRQMLRSINDCHEFITDPRNDRLVLFPIKYPDLWKQYQTLDCCFWRTSEIDFSTDLADWRHKLDDKTRRVIKVVLAFFASADGLVGANLLENFSERVKVPEARCFYAAQAANENVHAHTYSLSIDTFIENAEEQARLFAAIEHFESIRNKVRWTQRWVDATLWERVLRIVASVPFVGNWALIWLNRRFGERVVAFIAVEGIFFSASFAVLFWLKQKGLMPKLTFSNELISRDEGLHCMFPVSYLPRLKFKPTRERVLEIFLEAVRIEKKFAYEALPEDLDGLNARLMGEYVEFVADYWLKAMGIGPHFNTANPFPFMFNISLEGKTNFFEKRVGEYGKIKM